MPPCTVCWPGDLDIAQATLYDLLSRWVRHKPRADRDHAAFDLDDVLPRLTLKVMVGATHSRDKWLQFATMSRSYSQNFHWPGRCKAFMSVTLKVIVAATHSRDKWLQFATMRRSYS